MTRRGPKSELELRCYELGLSPVAAGADQALVLDEAGSGTHNMPTEDSHRPCTELEHK